MEFSVFVGCQWQSRIAKGWSGRSQVAKNYCGRSQVYMSFSLRGRNQIEAVQADLLPVVFV